MNIFARFALACALSLAAAGAVQQIAMSAGGDFEPSVALPPLVAIVLFIAVIFGAVVWWRRTAAAVHWAAAAMLMVMLAFGVVVYVAGVNSKSPGMGGNIGYGVAMIVDFYFLLPAVFAVVVHWLVLRHAALDMTPR